MNQEELKLFEVLLGSKVHLVIRGGAYQLEASCNRVACRSRYPSFNSYVDIFVSNLGFRVVRSYESWRN